MSVNPRPAVTTRWPWYTEHLGAAYAIMGGGGVLGGLAGAGAAWACTSQRLLSPDNPLAGAAMGIGGVWFGFLAAFAAILVTGRVR